MPDPALILKTTPPRASRAALPRERMTQLWSGLRDRTAISVAAPAGFGKTTLLAAWLGAITALNPSSTACSS